MKLLNLVISSLFICNILIGQGIYPNQLAPAPDSNMILKSKGNLLNAFDYEYINAGSGVNPIDSTILQSGYGIYTYETTPNNWVVEVDTTNDIPTLWDLSNMLIDSFTLKTSGQLRIKQKGFATKYVNSLIFGGSSLGSNYLPLFSGNQSITNSSGTGFVKVTSGNVSYDNSTYLTSEVDGSTSNELQTISTTGAAGNITLSNGGGTLNLNVNDADASPTNELELPSQTGNNGKFLKTDGSTATWQNDNNTTYSAGFGLGLNSTTFYNSRYWKNQDTVKTTLSGLLKATSGVLSAASAGTDYQAPLTNPATGTGTANYVTKFTGTSTIGNSIIRDDGTYLGIGVAPSAPYKLNVNGRLLVDNLQYTRAIDISSTDANDLTTAGFYVGSSVTNSPTAGFYYYTVQRYFYSADYVCQVATNMTANSNTWIRTRINGIWGTWYKFWTTEDYANLITGSGVTNYGAFWSGTNSITNPTGNNLFWNTNLNSIGILGYNKTLLAIGYGAEATNPWFNFSDQDGYVNLAWWCRYNGSNWIKTYANTIPGFRLYSDSNGLNYVVSSSGNIGDVVTFSSLMQLTANGVKFGQRTGTPYKSAAFDSSGKLVEAADLYTGTVTGTGTNTQLTKWTGTGSIGGIANGTGLLYNNGSGAYTWVSGSLPGLTSGKLWIGNYLGVASERTISGDATISDMGVLTLSGPSAARGYNNSSWTSTGGSYTKVDIATQDFATGSVSLSTTNNEFTVGETGYYEMSFSGYAQSASSSYIVVAFYNNETAQTPILAQEVGQTTASSLAKTEMIYCTSGDKLSVRVIGDYYNSVILLKSSINVKKIR